MQAIQSALGFNIVAGEWRLNKKLAGGGPLYDVGIYCLDACRCLTGEEPSQIAAFASTIDRDGRFDEVEENVTWNMKFPSGIMASCATSYGADTTGYFKVYGSKGWLQVDQAFAREGLHLRAELQGARLDEPNPARDPSHFQAEAEHFSHCVQNGLEPKSRARKACATCNASPRSIALPGSQAKNFKVAGLHLRRFSCNYEPFRTEFKVAFS